MTPMPPDVARAIEGYPGTTRDGILRLRALIHDVAGRSGTGPLEETLKWGQPSIVPANGSGTALRLAAHKRANFALFVHCLKRSVKNLNRSFWRSAAQDTNMARVAGFSDVSG